MSRRSLRVVAGGVAWIDYGERRTRASCSRAVHQDEVSLSSATVWVEAPRRIMLCEMKITSFLREKIRRILSGPCHFSSYEISYTDRGYGFGNNETER